MPLSPSARRLSSLPKLQVTWERVEYVMTDATAPSFHVRSSSSANLPSQTTCINGMVAKMQAAPYNCANGDEACYCRQADFGNGVRDCANEACGNAMLAANVISFAGQYCNGECRLPRASGSSNGLANTFGSSSCPRQCRRSHKLYRRSRRCCLQLRRRGRRCVVRGRHRDRFHHHRW